MFLAILISLLLIAFGLFVMYLLAVLLIQVVGIAVTLFKLATGRMTREQLAEKLAKDEERKRQTKMKRRGFFRGMWEGLSRWPKPLRDLYGEE